MVKAKLLLVEDSETQGSLVRRSLEKRGYTVLWAKSGIEGLKLARSENPDLVILDVVMGDMDGFAVCRWLKMHGETRDIPVIMLTVKGDLEHRIEGLNVGADDYLPKPFADEELEARIFASLRVKVGQMELKQRNMQLEAMLHRVEALAITDPLTGLFNRRRFAEGLRREFAVTKRYKNELSCIMMDIDHFKTINDRYGHEAGDEVLKTIAHTVAESLRELDLPARYGGEEFAILLPHTNKPSACVVAERLARLVRRLRFKLGDDRIAVTASFGVSATTDLTSDDAEDLLRAADAALYEAKRRGRDGVVSYDPDHALLGEQGQESDSE